MSKKSRLDSIDVPKPCAEDWNKMHGGEKSRFCGICEKNVYNISAMTAREAGKLLFKNEEKVCIRMEKDAHGKVKTLKNQFHQITRQAPIAAGVLSATLAFSAVALAQGEPIKINSDKAAIVQTAKNDALKPLISGIVTDQQGAVIPGIKITLRDVKNNTSLKMISNFDGFYRFGDVKSSVYEIEIEQDLGFKRFEYKDIVVNGQSNISLNITLESLRETIGVVAGDLNLQEIELPETKIENNITIVDIEELPPARQKFSLGLVAGTENRQTEKTSRLSLTIADITDSVIPGAEAILINQKTKQQFSAVSNERGIANFSYIPPGKYQLRVSALGFQIQTVSLKLKKGNETKKKLNLEAGATMGEIVITKP